MKLYPAILVFLFFLPANSQSQSLIKPEVHDSLWSVWKNESLPDTSRLSALKEIAHKGYLKSNADSTLFLAQKGLSFAQKKGVENYQSIMLNLIGLAYSAKGEYSKSMSNYEKSLAISIETGNKKNQADIYGNISNLLAKKEAFIESIKYAKKSLALHKEIDNNKGLLSTYNNIGATYYSMGEYDKSIQNFEKAVVILDKEDDLQMKALITGNIGVIYSVKGDLANAIEYIHKGLKIWEELGNKKQMASGLTNIGVIYEKMGNNEKALEYFNKAMKIYEEFDGQHGLMDLLNNIAVVHSANGDYEKAMDFYQRSLKIAKKIESNNGIANSLHNIGLLDMKMKNYGDALRKVIQAKDIREQNNLLKNLPGSYNAMAELYFINKNFSEAEKYGEKALKIAENKGDLRETQASANILYQIYKTLGKDSKSLKMHELYIESRDSIESEENQKEVIHQEYKYQYEKQAALDSIESAKKQKIAQATIAREKAENEKKETIQYALFGGLGLVIIFAVFIYNRFRLTRKQKSIIENQKKQVDIAFEQLEEKNTEILDSINYAKRIQSAILPPQKLVKKHLPESFVFYLPKDIVAGDFYWMEQAKDQVLFAAADCTGHGVPGAMVSVVCNNGLNRSVREYGLTEPAKILDKTREIVIQEFEKSEEDVKDGMDIALCALHSHSHSHSVLQYAGAHNPLWIIRNGAEEIEEIKADKQPIGKFGAQKPFTNHTVKLQKGDAIYIFSDGFPDQFGGEKGKKFKSKNFKKLLISIANESMEKQRELIAQTFEKWKDSIEQLDDVCIVGVRI